MGLVRPTRSYMIWFTQRVGSTWLAQALEDTGVAGRPREYLNVPWTDVTARRDQCWREGTTSNGVLGAKYGMTPAIHGELTALFSSAFGCDGERAAWDAVFPDCKHVFMMRRNKVRLAVSWWRAIASSEWHRPRRPDTPAGSQTPPPGLVDKYDASALDHLLAEVSFRETAIQEVFERWCVVPHTIVYEDLVADYAATFERLLRFVDLPLVAAPPPAFAPIADEVSARWYERYMAELTARLQ